MSLPLWIWSRMAFATRVARFSRDIPLQIDRLISLVEVSSMPLSAMVLDYAMVRAKGQREVRGRTSDL